jgi:hypothetical protein
MCPAAFPGVVCLLCLALAAPAPFGKQPAKTPPLKQRILGKWQWEQPPLAYGFCFDFARGGKVTFSVRVGRTWDRPRTASYRLLSESALEITIDQGSPTTRQPVTYQGEVKVIDGKAVLELGWRGSRSLKLRRGP